MHRLLKREAYMYRKELYELKIHIVQKGDTLWDIAQQYKVDFEQLKSLNVQISSPDMIMPGMKIKIPTEQKKVTHQDTKKHHKQKSSHKKTKAKHKPFEQSLMPHALPTLEDDSTKSPLSKKGTYLSPSEKMAEQTKPSDQQVKKMDEKYDQKKPIIQHGEKTSPPFIQQPTQQPIQQPIPYPMPPPMPCCQHQPYYYWPMQQMPYYTYGNAHYVHHPSMQQHYHYGQHMGQPKR